MQKTNEQELKYSIKGSQISFILTNKKYAKKTNKNTALKVHKF